MDGPYVIVWDLDGTLGDFDALHGVGKGTEPVRVRVRPGLPEALEALAAAGFLHSLLTLATPVYAEAALRGAGLRQLFCRVECFPQRPKGDAAGIGEALGLKEDERPHRMLFVGDHPYNDEPRDPRVLFHLEPRALARPAGELARLVLHLRETGAGSLRQGFDRLARRPWWGRLWPGRGGRGRPRPCFRRVPGVGRLVLVERAGECPVIGFADPAAPGAVAAEHSFVPAELMAQARAHPASG